MSYKVELSPETVEEIRRLPPPLQLHIVWELRRLAESPASHSKRCGPLERGQKFEFTYDQGGAHLYVTVYFTYGADEDTLHVFRVVTEFY
jgi:hypothetical protein